MLQQNTSIPLYEQLKQAIKADIAARIYQSGDRMPSEQELEGKYEVSRITVRRAVAELCEEGILERKQGKGTFVLNTKVKARFDRVTGFSDYMYSVGKRPETPVIEKVKLKASGRLADDLQIRTGAPLMYLKRLMKCDGKIYMIDECYFPMERFLGIWEKYQKDRSAYKFLREEYGILIHDFYKELSVRGATKEEAVLLECAPGTPLFDIYKVTYNGNGIPIQISKDACLGEYASYVITNRSDSAESAEGFLWKI